MNEFASLSRQAEAALRRPPTAATQQLLERLAALRPDRADTWFNLGWVRRQLGDYSGAAHAYGVALLRGVRRPEEAHLNRAVILSEFLERTHEARDELEQALRKRPNFAPALVNLGNLQEDLGDKAAALETYRRLDHVAPGHPRALARLAVLLPFDPALADRLKTVAAHAKGEERAELLFGLGQMLDAAGDFAAAFPVFVEANAAVESVIPLNKRYQPAAVEAQVDAVVAADWGASTAAEVQARPLTFICGMFRSGSTLIEQILAAHPDVTAGGEIEVIPNLVARELPGFPREATPLDPRRTVQFRSSYLERLAPLPVRRTTTDKRPDNILYLGLVKQLFPAARVVVTRRAMLDNILSIFFLNFDRGVSYGYRLEHAQHWCRQVERLTKRWQDLFGNALQVVDYEDVVTQPRPTITRVLDRLGLPWDERCLRFEKQVAPVRTPSAWQVRQPLHTRSVDRWRHYAKELRAHGLDVEDAT